MKKILIFNAFFWGLLLSIYAFAADRIYTDFSQPIIVKPINPVINVSLRSNPGTGYQWVLVKYDPALMEKPILLDQTSSSHLIGAPGASVWQFKFKPAAFAVSQKTTVVLEYKRPWEKASGKLLRIQILIKTK